MEFDLVLRRRAMEGYMENDLEIYGRELDEDNEEKLDELKRHLETDKRRKLSERREEHQRDINREMTRRRANMRRNMDEELDTERSKDLEIEREQKEQEKLRLRLLKIQRETQGWKNYTGSSENRARSRSTHGEKQTIKDPDLTRERQRTELAKHLVERAEIERETEVLRQLQREEENRGSRWSDAEQYSDDRW